MVTPKSSKLLLYFVLNFFLPTRCENLKRQDSVPTEDVIPTKGDSVFSFKVTARSAEVGSQDEAEVQRSSRAQSNVADLANSDKQLFILSCRSRGEYGPNSTGCEEPEKWIVQFISKSEVLRQAQVVVVDYDELNEIESDQEIKLPALVFKFRDVINEFVGRLEKKSDVNKFLSFIDKSSIREIGTGQHMEEELNGRLTDENGTLFILLHNSDNYYCRGRADNSGDTWGEYNYANRKFCKSTGNMSTCLENKFVIADVKPPDPELLDKKKLEEVGLLISLVVEKRMNITQLDKHCPILVAVSSNHFSVMEYMGREIWSRKEKDHKDSITEWIEAILESRRSGGSGWRMLREPLTNIEIMYYTGDWINRSAREKPTFTMIGFSGGIGVIALAVSIFWGLKTSSLYQN